MHRRPCGDDGDRPVRSIAAGPLTLAAIITRYGLGAIFVGAGIEGETVVVTGGVFAREGLLSLPGAMIAAAAGSCLVDQVWFFLGRYGRNVRWVRRITARPAFERATELVERYPTAFIFAFRFIYGMRTVSPIAIGTTKVRTRRFVPTNAAAAAIWGVLFTGIGYAFGAAIEPLMHRLKYKVLIIVGAMAALALAVAGIAWWLRRNRDRRAALPPARLGESEDSAVG